MSLLRTVRSLVLVLAVLPALGAQAVVTAADLARLETAVAEVRQLTAALEKTDAVRATEVSKAADDLDDEVTYLQVKLRREGSVSREEYADLRDRLETQRLKAQGRRIETSPAPDDPARRSVRIPVGAELSVRLQTSLNSATAKVEQRFEATTVLDYEVEGTRAIPAGATVRGFVSSVRAAGRLDRKGSLTLSFDELRIEERSSRLRASVFQALDGRMTEDNTRIGVGAVVGAAIGGLLGGGKGALIGAIVLGGGTIAATDGADVDLPAGTVLRIRVDQPIDVPVVQSIDVPVPIAP